MGKYNKPSLETLEEWRIDSKNWKLGMFYFNKKDKRIFPPKRNPILGWTVNFANPISIMALIAVIGLMVYITIRVNHA